MTLTTINPDDNSMSGTPGWSQVTIVLSPTQIAHMLSTMEHAVLFDSGSDPQRGHFDILSGQPTRTVCVNKDKPFSCSADIEGLRSGFQEIPSKYHSLPFVCGQVGYCAYEYGARQIIDHSHSFEHSKLPLFYYGYYTWSYVYDRDTNQGFVTFSPKCTLETRQLIGSLIKEGAHVTLPDSNMVTQLKWQKNIPFQSYLKRFNQIQEYIKAGDCYQINLAQGFQADFIGSPLKLYFQLRQQLDTPYSVFMSFAPNENLLSFSPEQFIGIRDGIIRTRPIKGTIENNANDSNPSRLVNSAKNQAENLMIVDLLRNDLSKVCQLNSVKVSELFKLESYQNVHHLVSTIEGKLRPGISEMEAFFACFPGGSITGAPKKRAMEIINELESSGRDAYCGSVFYLNDDGRFDSNILIRSIVHSGGKLHCWGGGGIVHDSTVEEEYLESLTKVANLTGIVC